MSDVDRVRIERAEAREQRLARGAEVLTKTEPTLDELAELVTLLQRDDPEPAMYPRVLDVLHGAEQQTTAAIATWRREPRLLASEQRLLERALQRAGRLSELMRAAETAARVEQLNHILRSTLPDSQRTA
ncbi:MAG: hypothetical protein HY657_17155 [Acidobacteria bacterium]|nr:hypothetical protein [Acidobacteriota bacterium]